MWLCFAGCENCNFFKKVSTENSIFFFSNILETYLFQNSGTESTEGTEIQCLGTKIQCLSASVPGTEKRALALSKIFGWHWKLALALNEIQSHFQLCSHSWLGLFSGSMKNNVIWQKRCVFLWRLRCSKYETLKVTWSRGFRAFFGRFLSIWWVIIV